MADARVAHIKAGLDRAFPRLSDTARRVIAVALVAFIDKAQDRGWNLETPFQLGGRQIDRGTALSRELKRLREEAGVSRDRVLHETRWSPAKLGRIEAGDVSISSTDLLFLLNLYGQNDHTTRERLLELNAADRAARRGR